MKPKILSEDLAVCRRFIKNNFWHVAKSMPQWPHEYALATKENHKDFDVFMDVIDEHGYEDTWGKRVDKYLVIDGLKYWGFDLPTPLINRSEPLSCAEIKMNGLRYLKKHKKQVGRYGKLIDKE